MKVKLKTNLISTLACIGNGSAGQVCNVPDELGQQLIDAGSVELVDDDADAKSEEETEHSKLVKAAQAQDAKEKADALRQKAQQGGKGKR